MGTNTAAAELQNEGKAIEGRAELRGRWGQGSPHIGDAYLHCTAEGAEGALHSGCNLCKSQTKIESNQIEEASRGDKKI